MIGFNAFALSGRDCSNTWYPGCRFACPGLSAPLGFQPALAKIIVAISMSVTETIAGSKYDFVVYRGAAGCICKCGLKAQWSTQPRASVATPWVSRVGAVAPWKGKSIITMCFRLLPDSSLCQNGKQVEIITKMIFELCYIEAIISKRYL